jgi:glutathione-regulated potassium-efflux system protein KefB
MAAEHADLASGALAQAGLFLAAAAIAAPLGRALKIGSIIGYLAAGILIGPDGLGYALYRPESVLSLAELGIVMLFFLIGLELRPKRLWAMRMSVFGYGMAQILLSTVALGVLLWLTGVPPLIAAFAGAALSLSSTAFTLQVLEEKKELSTKHGRLAFSVLLAQDLAAIPMIAGVGLLASGAGGAGLTLEGGLRAAVAVGAVVLIGRVVLDYLLRFVAKTGVREAMTAIDLLTVVSVVLLMHWAGLSAGLGGFLAGALLAESSYRHQLEADIKPFEGLLLGLFFTAIGMSLDLSVLSDRPLTVLAMVVAVLALKSAVLFGLGLHYGLTRPGARRLALASSQGGEFAFVLFAAALAVGVLAPDLATLLAVVVTLTMVATPFLLLLDDFLGGRDAKPAPAFDAMPDGEGHVIVAGFGRFGQIVSRILRARGIPFTALDVSSEQVDFVRRFGSEIYYGDASRPDILHAAQAGKARAFVLAIDDVEASMRTAEVVRREFPDLPIYARARNRQHVYRLMDLGITPIERETFRSAIVLGKSLLKGLGMREDEVRRLITTFQEHDERWLRESYQDASDVEKLQARARKFTEELEELFERDAERTADGSAHIQPETDRVA